jgi:hypothetical protein
VVCRWVIAAMLVALPAQASAEWQIKPFAGLTFGGSTTFLDLEHAVGKANLVWGVSGLLIGEVLGVEGDFARAPGFFQTGDQDLVLSSSVTTFTANVVFALPKSVFQYTLRPYFVAGAGILRAHEEHRFGTLPVATTLPAMDFGGGATGFVNDRVGVGWELRHFRSFRGQGSFNGVSFERERLSFWRATMTVAFRY